MPTRNVVLTGRHETLIESSVSAGRYQNAIEVLREGLRLIEEREAREATKLRALQDAARTGFADLDESRHRDVADDELEDYVAALGRVAGCRVYTAGP